MSEKVRMKRGLQPSKKLLVLDIAGVLIDGDAMKARRGGLDAFLTYVFENYHVVSYTSQKRYKNGKPSKPRPAGESRVRHAYADMRGRLVVELYGEDTVAAEGFFIDTFKPLTLKDMRNVWNHPSVLAVGTFDHNSTVVVDDTPIKWILDDAVVRLCPPTWDKSLQTTDVELVEGGRIYEAVSALAKASTEDFRVIADQLLEDPYWKKDTVDDEMRKAILLAARSESSM